MSPGLVMVENVTAIACCAPAVKSRFSGETKTPSDLRSFAAARRRVPLMGLVVDESARTVAQEVLRQALHELATQTVGGQAVHREIERRWLRDFSPQTERLHAAHERPPAHFSTHEASPLRLGISASDGREGHLEVVREISLRGKALAVRQLPARNVFGDSVGDGEIQRLLSI